MEKIKVCKSCGAPARASEKFCTECGERLPEENLFEAYRKQCRCCKNCGTIVSGSARFCPKCGEKLRRQT